MANTYFVIGFNDKRFKVNSLRVESGDLTLEQVMVKHPTGFEEELPNRIWFVDGSKVTLLAALSTKTGDWALKHKNIRQTGVQRLH